MEPLQEVWPDYKAPIVRNTPAGRELSYVRWGLPSSSQAIYQATTKRADGLRKKGQGGGLSATPEDGAGRRYHECPQCREQTLERWFEVEFRCVVPFTSFAEPDPANKPEGGRTPNAWFAADPSHPLLFFAGNWVPQWESVRKVKEGLTVNDLFGFLTTEPNGVVEPVHQKAMPAILTNSDGVEAWLTAPWEEAGQLQRPWRDDQLILVPTEKDAA